MFRVNLIVAYTFNKYGIGIKNNLPWLIKEDMEYFRDKTITPIAEDINPTKFDINDETVKYINVVVMGRKTFESIPSKNKPLKHRLNIVITNEPEKYENADLLIYTKIEDIFNVINKFNTNQIRDDDNKIYHTYNIYIIGGETIYDYALKNFDIDYIYATEIYNTFECDRFFNYDVNNVDKSDFTLYKCSKFKNENNIHYRFMIYTNKKYLKERIDNVFENIEEQNYLTLMKNILHNGVERTDRTNTGTISLFGEQLKYDLRDTFPLSTTKKMFFRAIFEELMLYLRGQTDNKILNLKGVHIWDGNTSREFLDARGLKHYEAGDMGETYGFNFRHFGGAYDGCNSGKTFEELGGCDQLSEAIRLIKEDPTSRRIIINLWNPVGNTRAALPSCLCMYQFYVDTVRKMLNLQIYIRSSDYFLANNWNTCTGALLVHLICSLEDINLTPGFLTVVMGDVHIYNTHLDAVKENLQRTPYPFCKLVIKKKRNNIEDYEFNDLMLVGYRSYPSIKAEMAI